jgi:hypothetical protein
VAVVRPARHRYHTHADQPTSEAGVISSLRGDLFFTLGEADLEARQVWVRAVDTPLLPWIWIGCSLMALGGLLAVVISLRPRSVVLAASAAALAGVAGLGWASRPSTAVIAAVGLCTVLAAWEIGFAFVRPLWEPAPEQPRCTSCDAPLASGSRFCHRCGAQVGTEASDA